MSPINLSANFVPSHQLSSFRVKHSSLQQSQEKFTGKAHADTFVKFGATPKQDADSKLQVLKQAFETVGNTISNQNTSVAGRAAGMVILQNAEQKFADAQSAVGGVINPDRIKSLDETRTAAINAANNHNMSNAGAKAALDVHKANVNKLLEEIGTYPQI